MLTGDVIMMPFALYSAITLRLGTTQHGIGGSGWLYLAVIVMSLPVFAKLGLCLAVIRYIGARAAATVLVGVTLSTILLLILNMTVTHKAVPTGAFVVYWAFALLYVAGSRFIVRVALQTPSATAKRVVI